VAAPQSISDLIEVPPIRTVIQLVDTDQADLRRELLESFVFTGEIRRLFVRLFEALARPHGLGAFLKGHYGSGKSHCLTYLHMLLQGEPAAWERCPQPQAACREKRWLVVSLPLLAHSAHADLEQVVMQAIEEAFWKSDGQRPVLADQTRLVDNFRRYIAPAYPEQLSGWEQLSPPQAAARALEFLRSLPENPLQLAYDRRQTMERLQQLLDGRGLVLLLDELSEFLRSRRDSFAEDLRYLQFLGESAEKMPLWIVATLQQNLDELGYGEEASYLRIKERYPLRYSLSARHVADLIEGRLIRRKPGSQAFLTQLWQQFDRAFPGLIEEAEFLRIYPVHPATLELLEHLMTLFSRHRGVVDFVHTRLAGDPIKGAEGILHEPPDRLLTPDAIFDHFRERFSELAHLAAYEQTVMAHLQDEIPRLFDQERDRQMALQCVKLLILIEVCPVPLGRSAEKLSQMLARRLSRVNPQANVTHLREKVLDVLVSRAAFVVQKGHDYALDLTANVNQVLGQRVRQKRQQISPDWSPVLGRLHRSNLPLSELLNRGLVSRRLRYRNSDRGLLWGLVHLQQFGYSELQKLGARLKREEPDAALLILSPGEIPQPAQIPADLPILFWAPAPPDPDQVELLLDWLAHQAVLEETRQRDLRNHLSQLVEGQAARLERAVAEMYASGSLVGSQGIQPVPIHETHLERFFEACFRSVLDRSFPRFGEIAPGLDGLSNKNAGRIWESLIKNPQSLVQDPLVEGLMAPLQLVERESGGYRLRTQVSGVAAHMLDQIPAQTRVSLKELALALAKGPWGLTWVQFCLVLACLVQQGRLQLYASARAMTLGHIDELLKYKADQVGLAETLSPQQLGQLQALAWMAGDTVTPARPREFWAACRDHLQGLHALALEVGKLLGRCAQSSVIPVQELWKGVERVEHVSAAVGQPHSSTTGLSRLLESGAAELVPIEALLLRWRDFLRTGARDFESSRQRLRQLGAEELLSELEQLPRRADPAQAWEDLRDRVNDYEDGYRQRYLEAHQAYYRHEVFQRRREWLQTPEWKLAQRLSQVLGLNVSVSPLSQRLDGLPQPCRRKLEEQLLVQPRCGCGYEVGQAPPECEDLLAEIRALVSQGCQGLIDYEPRLEEYLRGLHQLGQQQRAAQVDGVLSLASSLARPGSAPNFWGRACGQMLELLDHPCQELLSQALTGHSLVVNRSLADLVTALQDQRLPLSGVRKVFESWLQGEGVNADAWVHITGRSPGSGSSGAGAWLAAWLEQHGLEATPAMRRRYRFEGEAEGEPPEEELWDLLLPLMSHLEVGRERLFPRVSAELCRRALEARQPGLARLLPGDRDWEHLEVARAASAALDSLSQNDFRGLSRGWREWSRARHLDLGAGLLRPEFEESLSRELDQALAGCPLDGPPLDQVLERLARPWLSDKRLLVFLVDGLRWDLWDLMRDQLEALLGPCVDEVLAVSPLPSTTARARVALLGGSQESPAGSDGLLLDRPLRYLKAADEKRHRASAEELLRGPESAVLLHLNFIDSRRHESRLDLWALYQELLLEAKNRLYPLLRKVPRGSLLVLLSDHGFTDPACSRAHGGARPEERAVPAALWLPG